MAEYKYFKPSEFKLCNPPCRIDQLDPSLLEKLDKAREICGFPLVVNSAFRSPAYEASHGRSGTSSHCKGLAVDISCITPIYRLRMILAFLQVGFRRLGIYPNFIHVDIDSDKDECIWLK